MPSIRALLAAAAVTATLALPTVGVAAPAQADLCDLLHTCPTPTPTPTPTLPTPTPTPASPMVFAPRLGTCYDAGWAALGYHHHPNPAVRCDRPHTMWVAGSYQVPERLPMDQSSVSLAWWATTVCNRGEKAMTHAPAWKALARSTYVDAWYTPTAAQQAKGARWVTCTVSAIDAPHHLVRTTKVRPWTLANGVPKRLLGCANRNGRIVPCSDPHWHHPTASFWRTGDPSTDRAQRAIVTTCARHVRPKPYSYRLFMPTRHSYVFTCMSQ